jgi:hypothetical protein
MEGTMRVHSPREWHLKVTSPSSRQTSRFLFGVEARSKGKGRRIIVRAFKFLSSKRFCCLMACVGDGGDWFWHFVACPFHNVVSGANIVVLNDE